MAESPLVLNRVLPELDPAAAAVAVIREAADARRKSAGGTEVLRGERERERQNYETICECFNMIMSANRCLGLSMETKQWSMAVTRWLKWPNDESSSVTT